MGQVTQFFQPPLYWQQFEDLTQEIVKEIYGLPHADKIGRPGQAQDGVDVYGQSPKFGEIGVQCKRMDERDENNNFLPGGAITKKILRDEALKALSFKPKLDIWILATTAKRDANAQKNARILSQEHRANGRFDVIVWCWDDFVSRLNAFPNVQRWYYDKVIQVADDRAQDKLIIETIALAFDRPALTDPLGQEHLDDFGQALKDIQLALRTGELLERRNRHVIRKALGGWKLIGTPAWRSELEAINAELSELRQNLVNGIKNGGLTSKSGYLEVLDFKLAAEMDAQRSKCVDMLNSLLHDAGLPQL